MAITSQTRLVLTANVNLMAVSIKLQELINEKDAANSALRSELNDLLVCLGEPEILDVACLLIVGE